jgi:hypothetical protein
MPAHENIPENQKDMELNRNGLVVTMKQQICGYFVCICGSSGYYFTHQAAKPK